jgi:RNA polymerase sigma-70 factor, ECF subfamily
LKENNNDNELLLLLQSDSRKGFTQLVEKYGRRLYWHIRRLVISHEDADDALQNTFINCWKNIGNFRNESSLYTWLYSIATNEALMLIRKRSRITGEMVADINEILNDVPGNDTFFDGDEAEIRLQNAILTLPEKQRVVFMLRYYDEMPYDDIGKITGTSVGALKASYFHAVRKIEKIITS